MSGFDWLISPLIMQCLQARNCIESNTDFWLQLLEYYVFVYYNFSENQFCTEI